jgi:hypothetical protein
MLVEFFFTVTSRTTLITDQHRINESHPVERLFLRAMATNDITTSPTMML